LPAIKPASSHLYALGQKKQRLESEIRNLTAKSRPVQNDPGTNVPSLQVTEQSYHLAFSPDGLSSPSPTAYLGPGNIPRFLERLLKTAVYWHLASHMPIPERLLRDESSKISEPQYLTTLPLFHVLLDQRKLELQSLVPPSTQRAIIEHYMKVVSEQYPFLTHELESVTAMHENPLRWASANKDHSGAMALSIVFAVASTLIARDLDSTLSGISTRCINDVQKIAQKERPQGTQLETIRWTCTALCALALCEAINPTSGQLWDLLGRACSTIEGLREAYQLQNKDLDDAFLRLECSLLKLER